MTWPKGGPTRDQAAADALDRYWDSLMTTHPGGGSRPDELLEPGLTRIVRQLRYTDQAPRPEPAFAARLWGELMAASPAPDMASSTVAGASGGAGRGLVWPRHRFLVELTVAAALLVAVLGGGVALTLPVSLAPVMAPTAAARTSERDAATGGGPAACVPTVTPEPTRATGAIRPAPTAPPGPTARAGPGAPC